MQIHVYTADFVKQPPGSLQTTCSMLTAGAKESCLRVYDRFFEGCLRGECKFCSTDLGFIYEMYNCFVGLRHANIEYKSAPVGICIRSSSSLACMHLQWGCLYTYIYIHIDVRTFALFFNTGYIHIYLYIGIYVVQTCMHQGNAHLHAGIHMHILLYVYISIYVYVSICIYIYISIYVYILSIYLLTNISMCIYFVSIHPYIPIYISVYIYIYIYISIYPYIYISIYLYIYISLYLYIYIFIYLYIYISVYLIYISIIYIYIYHNSAME